jgi:hypothetical protein
MGPPKAESAGPRVARQSALCRREVSRCKSDHERQFSSRCRLAARAAGLHPAITGVRVPPPRPLPGSSTAERPPVKRRDVGANPTPTANFVGETASDVTCPICRHRSERHRGRRLFLRASFGGAPPGQFNFPHQGVVPKSRRLPSEGRSCRCKSCHPDHSRCGVV